MSVIRIFPVDRTRANLLRALRQLLGPATIIASDSRSWASALFVGMRHRLAIPLGGEDVEKRASRLMATLAEEDLPILGAFVADIDVVVRREGDRLVLAIEALTIEDA